MRHRRALIVAAGVAVLLLSVRGFRLRGRGRLRLPRYRRCGEEGQATLHDPASRRCVTPGEAARGYSRPPAHRGIALRPHTGAVGERLKFRSVIFP